MIWASSGDWNDGNRDGPSYEVGAAYGLPLPLSFAHALLGHVRCEHRACLAGLQDAESEKAEGGGGCNREDRRLCLVRDVAR